MLDVFILNSAVGPHGENHFSINTSQTETQLVFCFACPRHTKVLKDVEVDKLFFLNYWMLAELTESSKEILPKGFGVMLRSKIPDQIMVWLQCSCSELSLQEFVSLS